MADKTVSSSSGRSRSSRKSSGRRRTSTTGRERERELGPSSTGTWFKLGIPLAVLTIAALFGADRQPWVLAVCVMTGVFGLFFNKPPVKRPLFILWWTGLIFIVWHIFTLVSLPAPGLGTERADYFRHSNRKITELSQMLSREARPGNESEADLSISSRNLRAPAWNYGRLSLNQAGTKRVIVTLIGAWAMFWLAASMTLAQRMRFLAYLAVGGAAVAVIGLLGQYVIPLGSRLWWVFPAEQQVAPGPFLYTHHFIAFCVLLTPVALSMVIVPVPLIGRRRHQDDENYQPDNSARSGPDSFRAGKETDSRNHYSASETRLSSWSEDWLRTGRLRLLYGFCLLLLAAPPLLSLSRGGMVVIFIGCLTTLFFWLRNRSPLALVNAVLLIGLVFAFLQWPGAGQQTSLSLENETAPRRSMVMRETFAQWRDFKVFGGGGESFRVLNSNYKIEADTATPHYADNEYLQYLADHGLFGVLLGAVTFAVLLVAFWSNFHSRFQRTKTLRALRETWSRDRDIIRRHRSLYASVISLSLLAAVSGSIAGLLLLFACGFPARAPLNAFVAAALLGLIMPLPNKPSAERALHWHWVLIPFVAISFIVVLAWSGRDMKLDNPHYLRDADIPILARAIRGAPSYWVPWAELSQRIREQANARLQADDRVFSGASDHLRLYNFGVDCLERAAELNPRNTDFWRELARIRLEQDDVPSEKVVHPLKMSVRLSPENELIWRKWLDFVLSEQHLELGIELGREAHGRAHPELALDIWKEIKQLAQQLQTIEGEYRATVALTELQPGEASWWLEKARLASKLTKTEEEIEARRKITLLQPEDWENWLELGRLYRLEENRAAAERAFERVRQMQPEADNKIEEIMMSEPEQD